MTTHDLNIPLNTQGADLAIAIERILTRLTKCLNTETDAVKSNDTKALVALQSEKMALLEQYQGLSERLSKDGSSLNNLDSHIREHLKVVSAGFQEATAKNLQALQSGHNAITRLLNRIMETARKTMMQDHQKYNAKGALAENPKGTSIPTKLNETL